MSPSNVGMTMKQFQDNLMSDEDFADVADTLLSLGCEPQSTFLQSVSANYDDPYSGEAVMEVRCGRQHKWIYGKNNPVEVQSIFPEDPTVWGIKLNHCISVKLSLFA